MIGDFEMYLDHLIQQGGPTPSEYHEVDRRIWLLNEAVLSGDVDRDDLLGLQAHFDTEFRRETVHGHGLDKPFGYSGDFLIIDKIYLRHRTPHEPLAAWDDYFHSHAAPEAVRNRKEYFKRLLRSLEFEKKRTAPARVLNVGSGPGRSVHEFLGGVEPGDVSFTCVDMDRRALGYSRRLLRPWAGRIDFVEANALRYRTETRFDLVWSAGLFDYLNDKAFVRLLGRMWTWTKPGGLLVVGNFSKANPSRAYMELLGDWHLIHRTSEDLVRVAMSAGIPQKSIRVESEELGVNLFLRASRT